MTTLLKLCCCSCSVRLTGWCSPLLSSTLVGALLYSDLTRIPSLTNAQAESTSRICRARALLFRSSSSASLFRILAISAWEKERARDRGRRGVGEKLSARACVIRRDEHMNTRGIQGQNEDREQARTIVGTPQLPNRVHVNHYQPRNPDASRRRGAEFQSWRRECCQSRCLPWSHTNCVPSVVCQSIHVAHVC